MIEKMLAGMFKVVTEEAAANPDFARKLEVSLAKFADEYIEGRDAGRRVVDFHPFIEFRKGTPDEFRTFLMRFDAKELKLIIEKHRLDPAATLKGKTAKKALVDHIFAAAQKRTERDSKLFEY
jgi:hypothetical protein